MMYTCCTLSCRSQSHSGSFTLLKEFLSSTSPEPPLILSLNTSTMEMDSDPRSLLYGGHIPWVQELLKWFLPSFENIPQLRSEFPCTCQEQFFLSTESNSLWPTKPLEQQAFLFDIFSFSANSESLSFKDLFYLCCQTKEYLQMYVQGGICIRMIHRIYTLHEILFGKLFTSKAHLITERTKQKLALRPRYDNKDQDVEDLHILLTFFPLNVDQDTNIHLYGF